MFFSHYSYRHATTQCFTFAPLITTNGKVLVIYLVTYLVTYLKL